MSEKEQKERALALEHAIATVDACCETPGGCCDRACDACRESDLLRDCVAIPKARYEQLVEMEKQWVDQEERREEERRLEQEREYQERQAYERAREEEAMEQAYFEAQEAAHYAQMEQVPSTQEDKSDE